MLFHHAFNNTKTETKEKQIKEAIEKEAETQQVDLADDLSTKEIEKSEQKEETLDAKHDISDIQDNQKYEEEEMTESVTEEIFQVSEDGVTWKTVKKITTVTPSGTTEKIIDLGGICNQPLL